MNTCDTVITGTVLPQVPKIDTIPIPVQPILFLPAPVLFPIYYLLVVWKI